MKNNRALLPNRGGPHSTSSGILKYVLLAAAVIYVIASLYLMYGLKTQITALEQKQAALATAQDELVKRIHATSSELKADPEPTKWA